MESVARFMAAHAVALLMLSVGLRTPSSIFTDIAARWHVLVRALAVVWIAVPLLALIVLYVVEPPRVEAGTLMVMAICPGVPLVIGKAKRSHGDARTSLLVLISTAISALVLLPAWAVILDRVTALELTFGVRDAAAVLIPNVLLPFALGRLIGELAPAAAALLAKLAQTLFFAGILIIVIAVLARMLPALAALTLRDVLAALLIPFGAALLGYLAAPPVLGQRISLTYAAALGNPALALSVLALSYQHIQVIPFVLAFVLIRAIALVPFTIAFRRQAR